MSLAFGAHDAFNALIYGEQNPVVTDFLRDRFEHYTSMLGGAATSFKDKALAAFERFNGNAAIDFARKAVQQVINSGNASEIQRVVYLGELEQLQLASLTMQRWLMANPTVRQRYLDQKIDGYSDTYRNVHGACIGQWHYDYQLVTNGVMQVTEEGDVFWPEYNVELLEGDRPLTFGEQRAILDTWNVQNVLQAMGFDTTDPMGGKL